MIGKTDYIKRDASDLLIKIIPWNGLLVSESLSLLKEECFTGNEFFADILIPNIK